MRKTRVLVVLSILDDGLVKTVKFSSPKYVGDPINAVRIFNEKEVDEIVLLDIGASKEGRPPPFALLEDVVGEAFMPLAYGGGVTSLEQVRQLFTMGFEKVVIDSAAYANLQLISDSAKIFGSQSIVGCVDVRRNVWGRYELSSHSGQKKQVVSLEEHVVRLQEAGVGEILVNSVDRDGTMKGYDNALISKVSAMVDVPVVACGGAKDVEDMADAVKIGGASAVAAGSLFVFVGPRRAVLINYPEPGVLNELLS